MREKSGLMFCLVSGYTTKTNYFFKTKQEYKNIGLSKEQTQS